jgi:hypothetical protein
MCRGCRVSSTILYLAIVAIWACFLVPAWVRRPHANVSPADAAADGWSGAEPTDEQDQTAVQPGVGRGQGHRASVPPPMTEKAGDEHLVSSTSPSQGREQMLRARRRMLSILVTMTAVTGPFAFLGVVGWWICLPPAGILVLYVLLLREVAVADAALARKRHAWAMREARAAAARERAYWAGAEREAESEPIAQIIDISGRVGDQLYDQYADAAVRAVGD